VVQNCNHQTLDC